MELLRPPLISLVVHSFSPAWYLPTHRIFSSDMPKANKIHLCQLLKHIANVADSAEDAADELEFAAMKSVL